MNRRSLAKRIAASNAWLRISLFLLLLGTAWFPLGATVYLPDGWLYESDAAEIVVLVMLYVGFLVGLPVWGKWVHGWPRPFTRCGLRLHLPFFQNMLLALVIGVLGVFALFGLATLLGWATPTTPSPRLARFVIEGLVMALAVGFAEEMLFRGWVLSELEQDYSSRVSLLMTAIFFAATHFIKPLSEIVRTLPQFLGLVVLGMALGWARRSPTGKTGSQFTRLGYPIGLHAGLIWGYYIVNVGGLSEYTGRAPEWVTGIDSNPLAGLLGLTLLGLIARQFAKTAKPMTEKPVPVS
ncbi:MAG: type II CAAX endopeptidase family protein [Cyanobacteria bacterium J06621_11]